MKKTLRAASSGEKEEAVAQLKAAMPIIDSAVGKGLIHKNAAARKKRQLHLKVKALEGAPAAAE